MPRAKGERRLEILKALAQMLEAPKWERITTAALAENAQRLRGGALPPFRLEGADVRRPDRVHRDLGVHRSPTASPRTRPTATSQAEKLTEMLLAFAEKNPGMVRVMTGDALVGEHERLQARMNQFFDRFEATLKQALRTAEDGDAGGRAAALLRYSIGCMHQFGKSGFSKKPSESFSAQRKYLLN